MMVMESKNNSLKYVILKHLCENELILLKSLQLIE